MRPRVAAARNRGGATIELPIARALDPHQQPIRDWRYAVRGGDQRSEFALGEVGRGRETMRAGYKICRSVFHRTAVA